MDAPHIAPGHCRTGGTRPETWTMALYMVLMEVLISSIYIYAVYIYMLYIYMLYIYIYAVYIYICCMIAYVL